MPKMHAAAAAAIERRERVVAQTIWAREMIAQEHGRVFEDLWDALNAATNKLALAAAFPFDTISLGAFDRLERLPHQIDSHSSTKPAHSMSSNDWPAFLQKFGDAGWRLMQCEFRHNAFDPQTNDIPARSRFYFSAHLTNASPARAALEGDILVEWKPRATNEPPRVARLDAIALELKIRPGPPAFVPIFEGAFDHPERSAYIEPLNVFDLDGDGRLEIILPALNRVYRLNGSAFDTRNLYPPQRLQILNGIFADFDRDGFTDFLLVNFDGLFLLEGPDFKKTPRAVCGPLEDLKGPRALATGDVDNDGDLDVFIGQYKGPFEGGNMPMPYYDANDGYPSYLLLNDGRANFKDATANAGLAAKRFRRVYAASFVDLDADGALDLAVTSDFAGADIYRNDTRGHFTDVTGAWLPEPHAFGMAHAFGDFNNDGLLDFFVAGMTSPTAERLEHLRLIRPFSKFDPARRARMIDGSRLYLASTTNRFVDVGSKQHIARTGWSWGCATADFDNDGWLDLYVANGMESKESVRDYDSEFWLHDIFVGDSKGSPALETYFATKGGATRGKGMSYGGYDKNRLYVGKSGSGFFDAAPLLGAALEDDCRNLVAADYDTDGRVDLVMTSVEVVPPYKQRLYVFRNELPQRGNWIAFQFTDEPGTPSSIGATVRLRVSEQSRVQQLVAGDSFRSQHPCIVRFGLGDSNSVASAEIKWPGGESLHIARPEINQLVRVRKPR